MSIKEKSPEFYEYYPKLFHDYYSEIDTDIIKTIKFPSLLVSALIPVFTFMTTVVCRTNPLTEKTFPKTIFCAKAVIPTEVKSRYFILSDPLNILSTLSKSSINQYYKQ